MRTTLDVDDDVLQAAKELARQGGQTAGKMLSTLARLGLNRESHLSGTVRNGVPVLESRKEVITLEHIRQLRDEEAI